MSEITKKVYKHRHILKSITWRAIASVTTFFVSWGITGSLEAGAGIMSVEAVLKMGLYYAHERAWYNWDFGIDKK